MRTIINADDFGKDSKVNAAIQGCIERRRISSTTLMANGLACDEAIAFAKAHPVVSYGVHLVADELEALTHNPIFVQNGITDEKFQFVKGCLSGKHLNDALLRALFEEWDAQISKLKESGMKLSHMDSHHHVHTLPQLLPVLLQLASKHDIKRIRLSQIRPLSVKLREKKPRGGTGKVRPRSADTPKVNASTLSFAEKAKRIAAAYWWQSKVKRHFVTADFFCPVRYFHCNQNLVETRYRNGVVELMCHPGHPAYEDETLLLDGLCDGSHLITYDQL